MARARSTSLGAIAQCLRTCRMPCHQAPSIDKKVTAGAALNSELRCGGTRIPSRSWQGSTYGPRLALEHCLRTCRIPCHEAPFGRHEGHSEHCAQELQQRGVRVARTRSTSPGANCMMSENVSHAMPQAPSNRHEATPRTALRHRTGVRMAGARSSHPAPPAIG